MSDDHRKWYDDHAGIFTNAVAIEIGFVGLSTLQQERLNRFKLWAFREGGLLHWRERDVLDFGAGHGRFALDFAGYRSYLGIDFSSELVAIGRKRLHAAGLDRAELEVGDCLDFAGPDAAYDIVISLGMLPYVDDLPAVIRKMARHVRPGGQIIGDFHHSTPILDPMRKVKWRLSSQTGGTSRVDTGDYIRSVLAAAGLTDIRVTMREYPLLGSWYARSGWTWLLTFRNFLARHRWANWFATDGCFIATRTEGT